ncbi:DUF3419 family protein [Pseudomarimonas arenosa]|uniref:BtaA family protein n=1 Tax=Pseudomarimonas arenosa TaxID=2774145 RepID=A0AAW3ZJH4_9GAMM|nr:BtaA family protein [Pseudomarimonas arenosa]MBD8526248.1 BtaA family protein [Pseudomarimonas arenosa]
MAAWRERLDQRVFNALTRNSLIYNACWEDPAVDRRILGLSDQDEVLVITSGGCNALDYALAGARRIHAVDMNPAQNALLELKLTALRRLEFEDLWLLFGAGHHRKAGRVYRQALRGDLSDPARHYWDQRIRWFSSPRGSFYFHGLSGFAAFGARRYFRFRPALRCAIDAMFAAENLQEQAAIYQHEVAPRLWNGPVNRLLSSQWVMNLLGVPQAQRKLVELQHGGKVAGFIQHAVQYVACQLSLRDNYFWRVYFHGSYTPECCPEYLKPLNAERLKQGLWERVQWHTDTVTGFLSTHRGSISRFVLLDHMDWMGLHHPQALQEEWEWIVRRSTPGARILLRSAQACPGYLERVVVGPEQRRLRDLLAFPEHGIDDWQSSDRVHTYAGLVIADAPA